MYNEEIFVNEVDIMSELIIRLEEQIANPETTEVKNRAYHNGIHRLRDKIEEINTALTA